MPGLAELVAQFEARKAAIEMRSARYQASLLTIKTLIENFFVELTTAGVTKKDLEDPEKNVRHQPFNFETVKSLVFACLSPEVNTLELLDAATYPLGMECKHAIIPCPSLEVDATKLQDASNDSLNQECMSKAPPCLYQNVSEINYSGRANRFMDKLVYALSAYRVCLKLKLFYDDILGQMNNVLLYKDCLDEQSLPIDENLHVLARTPELNARENKIREQYDALSLFDNPITESLATILKAFLLQYDEGYSRHPNATTLGKSVNSPFQSLYKEISTNIVYEGPSQLDKVDAELHDLFGEDGLVSQVKLAYLAEASKVVSAQRTIVRESLRKAGYFVKIAETPTQAEHQSTIPVSRNTEAFYSTARRTLGDFSWSVPVRP